MEQPRVDEPAGPGDDEEYDSEIEAGGEEVYDLENMVDDLQKLAAIGSLLSKPKASSPAAVFRDTTDLLRAVTALTGGDLSPTESLLQGPRALAIQATASGNLEGGDPEETIRCTEELLAAAPPGDPKRAGLLASLGRLASRRYNESGDLHHLDEAVRKAEEAVVETPADCPGRHPRFLQLAKAYHVRYMQAGNAADLEKAIQRVQETLAWEALEDDSQRQAMEHLGTYLGARYDRFGDLSDLGVAIQLSEELAETASSGRGSALAQLSNLLKSRYQRLGCPDDLSMAVQRAEEAVAATPADDPNLAVQLCTLSSRLADRYKLQGNLDDLDAAVQQIEKVVEIVPAGDPNRAAALNNLSNRLSDRYDRLGNLDDLDAAVQRSKESVAATSPGHTDRPSRLRNLSSRLYSRFERLGYLADLSLAIQYAKEAVAETPIDHPGRATSLATLGNGLYARYNRLGNVDDLTMAIRRIEEAVAIIPAEHTDRAVILNNLSALLLSRYQHLGSLEDLAMALQRGKESLAATPPGDPSHTGSLSNLSSISWERYRRLGDLDDLAIATQWGQEAVAESPVNHPDRARMLGNLGNYLSARFKRLGNLGDLTMAIQNTEEAIAATPTDHAGRADILGNLSGKLFNRYERLGDLNDLAMAIQWSEEAAEATPVDHPGRERHLRNLSTLLSSRYTRLGNPDDLTAAMQQLEEAEKVAHAGRHSASGDRLDSLSQLLAQKYERHGSLEDLSMAVKWAEQAVAETPPDHPQRPNQLRHLSIYLSHRYERLGSLADIAMAIKRAEEALAETPLDHPERANMLITLANCLTTRFERLSDKNDAIRSLQLVEEAVAATSIDHPGRASRLCNLSNRLSNRYLLQGTGDDLTAAVQAATNGLTTTPTGHPHRAAALVSMGKRLISVSEELKAPELLEKGIECYQEAVSLTPVLSPILGKLLLLLSGASLLKYIKTSSVKDLYYASRTSRSAWDCKTSSPIVRLSAAHTAAVSLLSLGSIEDASSLLEDAVNTLPQLSPRLLHTCDHQHNLSVFSELASYASSTALMAGKGASHSLKLLELGRGVITGLSIDCRGDVSELKERYPLTHAKFNRLRTELDSPSPELKQATYEQQRDERNRAAREFDETLEEIRQLPGFDRFQLPPSPEHLMKIANEGPIIVVNCTPFQSDAIIVSSPSIKAVPLPKLKHDEVAKRMKELHSDILQGPRSTYTARNRQLQALLQWLWDVAVEPICNELCLEPVSDGSALPRVWWIGVGPLAMAPFHAAGDHSRGSTQNMISRAVSSYISTIKALSYAREGKLGLLDQKDPKILLVTMPETPEYAPLRYVNDEVCLIASVAPEDIATTLLETPSAEDVLRELPSHQAVHFACHGIPDAKDPSNSSLLLLKSDPLGTGLELLDRLTVGAISSRNMRGGNAQIAYLSACSTAVNEAKTLQDESIHIANGFQLAGFSHVLATLWNAQDTAAQSVAVEFYRFLFAGEANETEHAKVSYSFHHAVKLLREKKRNQPILWASFIHTGA